MTDLEIANIKLHCLQLVLEYLPNEPEPNIKAEKFYEFVSNSRPDNE